MEGLEEKVNNIFGHLISDAATEIHAYAKEKGICQEED
jgi:hypothetical protein